MKRHGLALIVHPYKNTLLKKEALQKYLDAFAEKLLDIASAHSNLRINLVLPGYMLQYIDPLLLSRLNEVRKSDCLEWLTPGYTEAFLSFSPLWLSGENIQYSMETFNDLVGCKPSGYIPAFSNWEPSFINTLRDIGINYTVLSRSLLPEDTRNYCGYWITEHCGDSMVIIPAHNLHFYNAPANIHDWIDKVVDESTDIMPVQLITLHYMCPLVTEKNKDSFMWLNSFAKALDSLLEKYQMNLLNEFPSLVQPLGLQYIQSHFLFKSDKDTSIPLCSNYLHTFDSVGIMQRKMLDISENIAAHENNKEILPLKKELFYVQDVNRYLPNTPGGFSDITDRFWTFNKMIDVECELLKKDKIRGGQIRIADFLKNGTKSIIMSNKNCKVYIEHKNGGHIFELDYRPRSANLLSGHNPERHELPNIFIGGKSCASFIDYFLEEDCQRADFISDYAKQLGDFVDSQFDYNVRKTKTGVKTILTRQGSINVDNKLYPINMEKVFGLEKDKPELAFIYQLSNHSLTTYAFKFAVKFTFSLPGVVSRQAHISCNNITYDKLMRERITIEDVTELSLSDSKIGVAVVLTTQKPVSVWCYPVSQTGSYQGTTLVISTPVSLKENFVWSLWGKIVCKKVRIKGAVTDVV
jgi:hypothetical protein